MGRHRLVSLFEMGKRVFALITLHEMGSSGVHNKL